MLSGGVNPLAQYAIPALNAGNDELSYDLSESEVLSCFTGVIEGGDLENVRDKFQDLNEQGCPSP